MLIGEAFAKRLKQLIDERGITVYKLAKMSAVHRSTIDSILNGEVKSPTIATLYQLCAGLGISPIDFLNCQIMLSDEVDFFVRK